MAEGTPDKFQLREIEKELTHELQIARERLRTASTEMERQRATESFNGCLKSFADFCAKGIVPEKLHSQVA